MDVVFEGSLTNSWGIKDVLRTAMEESNLPWSVLRLSSTKPSQDQAKILIAGSKYIVAAFCPGSSSDIDPYEALRTALSVSEGTFALLALTETEADNFDQSLYVSIDRVIDSLHELPKVSSDLFDEKGLLDQVFGAQEKVEIEVEQRASLESSAKTNSTNPYVPCNKYGKSSLSGITNAAVGIPTGNIQSSPRILPHSPADSSANSSKNSSNAASNNPSNSLSNIQLNNRTSASNAEPRYSGNLATAPHDEISAPIASWNTVEPLFQGDDRFVSGSTTPMIPGFVQSKSEQSGSRARLRALPRDTNTIGFSWQRLWYEIRAFQWLPLILLLVGIASFLAPQLWSNGGSEAHNSNGRARQEAAAPSAQVH